MLPKLKSVGLSIITNTYMTCLGLMGYNILQNIVLLQIPYQMLLCFIMFLMKNYILATIIDVGLRNKKNISEDKPIEAYKGEFFINVCQASFIETCTVLLINKYYFTFPIVNFNLFWEFLGFIWLSFIFELVFDFFHYWTHRLGHMPVFYKLSHKKHHKFAHPSTITTFYQDPLDLVMTNSVPMVLTMCIIPRVTFFQFVMIILYKTYIELSGHCGKELYPVSCFPQFMWLPKWLGIELHAEDHDVHHSVNNCNYSKRFSLWDKVFGTFCKVEYKNNGV